SCSRPTKPVKKTGPGVSLASVNSRRRPKPGLTGNKETRSTTYPVRTSSEGYGSYAGRRNTARTAASWSCSSAANRRVTVPAQVSPALRPSDDPRTVSSSVNAAPAVVSATPNGLRHATSAVAVTESHVANGGGGNSTSATSGPGRSAGTTWT